MLSKTGLSGLGHFWIYLRMSVGLPQVSSSVSRSQNWVQEGQTLLSRRLSSLPLSLSPTLSLALSFQTTSLPKIRARFFSPHLLISTVFSLFVPSFEFLIIAFFPREWLISVLCPSSLIIISTTSATGVIIVIIIHHVSIHHSHLPYVLEFPVHKNFSSTIALTTYAVSLL